MVEWHHCLDGHEFEKALGVGDGRGSLVCCSPWGHRVGHDLATEQQMILVHRESCWELVDTVPLWLQMAPSVEVRSGTAAVLLLS